MPGDEFDEFPERASSQREADGQGGDGAPGQGDAGRAGDADEEGGVQQRRGERGRDGVGQVVPPPRRPVLVEAEHPERVEEARRRDPQRDARRDVDGVHGVVVVPLPERFEEHHADGDLEGDDGDVGRCSRRAWLFLRRASPWSVGSVALRCAGPPGRRGDVALREVGVGLRWKQGDDAHGDSGEDAPDGRVDDSDGERSEDDAAE